MKREFGLFKYLVNKRVPVKIEELAEHFEVSERSIRNDLLKVSGYLEGTAVRLIRDKGNVRLNVEDLSPADIDSVMVKMKDSDFYDDEERYHIVMQMLLMKKPCSISSLSEQTKVARSAAIRTLAVCEKWLNAKDIVLNRRTPSGIRIECDELSYRRACITYINSFIADVDYQWLYRDIRKEGFLLFNIWANEFVQYFIDGLNIVSVRNNIRSYEEEQNTRLTDESFVFMFFALCVTLKRASMGKRLTKKAFKDFALTEFKDREQWFERQRLYFSENMGITLDNEDLKCILVWFLGSSKRYLPDKSIGMFNERVLVERFIGIVENCLAIDLTEDVALRNNLTMHLTPTIHRMMYGIVIENPLKESIKNEYPEIYKACEKGCVYLKEQLGIMPNDDEISFLTMHIAVSVENNRKPEKNFNFYKVIVVCASGVATSNMLASRLVNTFPNLIIEKICLVDGFSPEEAEQVDFVVSTVPLARQIHIPIFCVSPLLRESEKEELKKFMFLKETNDVDRSKQIASDIISIVEEVYGTSESDRLRIKVLEYFNNSKVFDQKGRHLSDFVQEETVLTGREFTTSDEAVRAAGELLYKAGFTEERYIDSLLEMKEVMGDSIAVAKGIVLAHAKPSAGSKRTGFSFITLKKPLIFGVGELDPIGMVMALSATADNNHLDALSELLDLIEDEDAVRRLHGAASAKEFRNILIDFESNKHK